MQYYNIVITLMIIIPIILVCTGSLLFASGKYLTDTVANQMLYENYITVKKPEFRNPEDYLDLIRTILPGEIDTFTMLINEPDAWAIFQSKSAIAFCNCDPNYYYGVKATKAFPFDYAAINEQKSDTDWISPLLNRYTYQDLAAIAQEAVSDYIKNGPLQTRKKK